MQTYYSIDAVNMEVKGYEPARHHRAAEKQISSFLFVFFDEL